MTAPSAPVAVLLDTIWRAYKRRSCTKFTAIDHLRYVAGWFLNDVGASELLDCDVAPSARYEVES